MIRRSRAIVCLTPLLALVAVTAAERPIPFRPESVPPAIQSLRLAIGPAGASCSTSAAATSQGFRAIQSSRRMPDGREWTTENLNVAAGASYCYDDAEPNCRRFGRLYTWESARQGCHSLGEGWRLPTNDDWRRMAGHYGGVRGDSDDGGRAAFEALSIGGRSGFDALLGGNRADDGQYARLEAHGFYWTASETESSAAWFYNFGGGGQSLSRHDDGGKQMALSVRCVRD